MTDPYWQAVTALGRLDEAPGPELNDLDPVRLHDLIVSSKVVRIALDRLAGMPCALADLLGATDAAEGFRHAETAAMTRAVVATAAELGARVIKGLAMQPRYPDPQLRHAGDIDLQAGDWLTAFELAQRLRSAGWPWDVMEYPWLKWDESGLLYGQLAFLHLTDRPFARVDVHIGAYSVGHAGRMPLAGWEPGTVCGQTVLVPNREHAIALIAAHALGDTRLSMKDLNDLFVLTGDGRLDWPSIVDLCRGAYAEEVLGQLLAELSTIYPRTADVPVLAHLPRLVPAGLDSDRRGAHFAWHTHHDERARGASEKEATLLAQEARRYFSADLRPRLSPQALRLGTGRNVCWRLLPEQVWAPWVSGTKDSAPVSQRELAAGLALHRRGLATVVTIGEEVFVPTVWGDVTAESARLAADVAS